MSPLRKPSVSTNIVQSIRKKLQERQHGLCAICRVNKGTLLDHDHKTLLIRGLLCVLCNAFVGRYENPKDSLFKKGAMDTVWSTVHLSTHELKARIAAYLSNPPARGLKTKYPFETKRRKVRTSINLSKESVKFAKDLELNISQIAEVALRGEGLKRKQASERNVRLAYATLFTAMKPLLVTYDPIVLVGLTRPDLEDAYESVTRDEILASGPEPAWYFLTKETLFENKHSGELDAPKDISLDNIQLCDLLPGNVIVENLITSIMKETKANMATIRELIIAQRIINTITNQLLGSGHEDLLYNEQRDVEAAMKNAKLGTCHDCRKKHVYVTPYGPRAELLCGSCKSKQLQVDSILRVP